MDLESGTLPYRSGLHESPRRLFAAIEDCALLTLPQTLACTGLLFHNLRRSAIKYMIPEVGISEKQARVISGHKTASCLGPLQYRRVTRHCQRGVQDGSVS